MSPSTHPRQWDKPTRSATPHADAIEDTGDGFVVGRVGWLIACLWCPWQATAPTQQVAIALYVDHEAQALADEGVRQR